MNTAGLLFLVSLVLFLARLCSGPADEWDPGLTGEGAYKQFIRERGIATIAAATAAVASGTAESEIAALERAASVAATAAASEVE